MVSTSPPPAFPFFAELTCRNLALQLSFLSRVTPLSSSFPWISFPLFRTPLRRFSVTLHSGLRSATPDLLGQLVLTLLLASLPPPVCPLQEAGGREEQLVLTLLLVLLLLLFASLPPPVYPLLEEGGREERLALTLLLLRAG